MSAINGLYQTGLAHLPALKVIITSLRHAKCSLGVMEWPLSPQYSWSLLRMQKEETIRSQKFPLVYVVSIELDLSLHLVQRALGIPQTLLANVGLVPLVSIVTTVH